VELELTTADPLPRSSLRPRGERVPRRELGNLDALSRLAAELAEYDDRLVVLGGHGDPLQHPQFAAVCRRLRSAGVYGIAVVTPLVDLRDATMEVLFDDKIDVVEVLLDAHSAETYQRVQQADHFAQVVGNVERLEQARRKRESARPLLVCSLTRCEGTIKELEAFYDSWIPKIGSAIIRGHNDYCGLLPADTLLPSTPSVRESCRRLATRLCLLADGTVALCAQDVAGSVRLGNWVTEPLREIWAGRPLATVRAAHGDLNLEALPLCARCREWSRP
jgi:hypothetical protein